MFTLPRISTGALLGAGAAWLVPAAGIDVRVAALVGMATIFAGASRRLDGPAKSSSAIERRACNSQR